MYRKQVNTQTRTRSAQVDQIHVRDVNNRRDVVVIGNTGWNLFLRMCAINPITIASHVMCSHIPNSGFRTNLFFKKTVVVDGQTSIATATENVHF